MSIIEKARKLINEADNARSQSAWEGAAGELITLVDDELLKELEQYKAVVDAAGNMIDMYDVSTGVEVAKARILLEKALSNLKEKE